MNKNNTALNGLQWTDLKGWIKPETIFSEMGLRFLGVWQMPKGRPDAYCFDAPDGSTLLMDGPVNRESVLVKLAEHDLIVKEFQDAR